MFSFEVKQGYISNKQDIQNISGRMHKGTGHVRTKNKSVFNIDGEAAQINGSSGHYLNPEDEVLAVGETTSSGIFQITGFKNLSTGVVQYASTIAPTVLGLCCLFLGLWTFFLIITPIIFVPLGLLGIRGAYKNWQANKFLDMQIAT